MEPMQLGAAERQAGLLQSPRRQSRRGRAIAIIGGVLLLLLPQINLLPQDDDIRAGCEESRGVLWVSEVDVCKPTVFRSAPHH